MKIVQLHNNSVAVFADEIPLILAGYPVMEADELPTGIGTLKCDAATGRLWREDTSQPQPAPPTAAERIAALETAKADKTELDELSAAIVRGLSL